MQATILQMPAKRYPQLLDTCILTAYFILMIGMIIIYKSGLPTVISVTSVT